MERIIHLYGAVSQPEIINFLRTQCEFKNPSELAEVALSWSKAAAEFNKLPADQSDLPEAISVQEIPNQFASSVDKIAQSALFRNTFSLLPYAFKIVDPDLLVAPQRYVNLNYIEKLTEKFPTDIGMDYLIDYCLKGGSPPSAPSELQLGPNVYSYKSESTDFRFLGGYPKRLTDDDVEYALGGGQPVAALLLFVGYGSPTVNVYQVGKRFILNNGFHRLFALRRKGMLKAPVVVQQITNWNLELAPQISGIPTTYLVTTPRPSLLKDFFSPSISRELPMKSRDRSVQIQWNANQVDVPR
ncbi:MAG TPA: hypothetical protein VGR56_01160 [Nitrososphaerales archaeon]|nr:hypothetical protein [Nitrososphaerales archaeon]